MADAELVSPFVLEYAYKRSTGPILGRFLTGLREGKILAATTTRGPVLCPPSEYDPETGEDILDLVEVGPEGCLLYTSPSPRDQRGSRMPSSA